MTELSPSGPTPITSRRQFLKRIGEMMLGAAFMPPPPDAGPVVMSKETWKENRFFVDIDRFDPDKLLPVIEHELFGFTTQYRAQLEAAVGFNDVDEETWQANVRDACALLRRMHRAYQGIRHEPSWKPEDKRYIQEDFGDAASRLWAVLRVKERFAKHPQALAAALNRPDVNHFYELGDPFLGEEIFTLTAPWTDAWSDARDFKNGTRYTSQPSSPLFGLLTNRDSNVTLMSADLRWWKTRKGKNALYNYTADTKTSGRPMQMKILCEKFPGLEKEIIDLLETYQLDRAVRELIVHEYPHSVSGQYDNEARAIELNFDKIDADTLRNYPHIWRKLLLHELGHATKALVPFLEDDLRVLDHKRTIDRMLSPLRYVRSLQAFFQPDGFVTPLFGDRTGQIEEDNKRDQLINETYLTDYAAYRFTSLASFWDYNLFMELYALRYPERDQSDNPALVYRMFYDTEKTVKEEDCATFAQYYQKLMPKIVTILRQPDSTDLEVDIFTRIRKNLNLFDAPKRALYKEAQKNHTWGRYLESVVIPMVTYCTFIENPRVMNSLVLGTIPQTKKLWGNHLLAMYRWHSDVMVHNADRELLPEIWQSALRRKDQGVTTQLSAQLATALDAMEKEFRGILADLIRDGLAFEPDRAVT